MTILKIAGALALLYLVVVLLAALLQDRLLFPRWAMRDGPVPLPPAAERLSVEVPGTGRLAGVLLPATQGPPPGAALILGFGGNAWEADELAAYLHAAFPDRAVASFHYRGYGPSDGRPGARAILDDALRIHDEIAATRGPARIVAVGFSLGAGPAAHLAANRDLAGAILVTPFDSLAALAGDLYPWLPVRLLLRHEMDVAAALAQGGSPTAIIAAGQDRVVPPRRTDALRRAGGRLVLDRTIPGVGHNDIYESAAFTAALRDALRRIEADPGR